MMEQGSLATVSTIEKLSTKVDEVLRRYESLKAENDSLRQEVMTLKASAEAKDNQIIKLEEELSMKELEAEDIVSKIESIFAK